uniref:Uncharacterized protein n=1 Tax=Solanum lycopersicum TaxID=4081 RepID=A0A3Q7J843_SOLLC
MDTLIHLKPTCFLVYGLHLLGAVSKLASMFDLIILLCPLKILVKIRDMSYPLLVKLIMRYL